MAQLLKDIFTYFSILLQTKDQAQTFLSDNRKRSTKNLLMETILNNAKTIQNAYKNMIEERISEEDYIKGINYFFLDNSKSNSMEQFIKYRNLYTSKGQIVPYEYLKKEVLSKQMALLNESLKQTGIKIDSKNPLYLTAREGGENALMIMVNQQYKSFKLIYLVINFHLLKNAYLDAIDEIINTIRKDIRASQTQIYQFQELIKEIFYRLKMNKTQDEIKPERIMKLNKTMLDDLKKRSLQNQQIIKDIISSSEDMFSNVRISQNAIFKQNSAIQHKPQTKNTGT